MIRHMQVETTNICNAHCQFCPHDRIVNLGIMEEKLYRKIVDDAAQYNLISFAPMLTGEPFCDPNIIDRIGYAREKMPGTLIRLFTNGGLMKREYVDALAEIPRIQVSVSVNGQNRERRHELMGLDDFDHVMGIIGYMGEKNIDFAVTTVWHPVYTIGETNEFLRLPNASLIRFQSFGGHIYPYRRTKPTSCKRATEWMTVLWDGRVNLCCFDPFGEVIFGDINTHTIQEIWESEIHMNWVKMHQSGNGQKLKQCMNCTEGA